MDPTRTHVFHDSGQVTWNQVPICACGMAKPARVHDVPAVSAAAKALDARRLGEEPP